MSQGTIALDIDGTLTDGFHHLSGPVASHLEKLVQEGWEIIFITGRPHGWGEKVLEHLSFPHKIALWNGAVILQMPENRVVSKLYLNGDVYPGMEDICSDEGTDFVVYSGEEHRFASYFRSRRFSSAFLEYFHSRRTEFSEEWIDVEELPDLAFPSAKCFGDVEAAGRMASRIESELGLHAPIIRDPFAPEVYLVQATHAEASKGGALRRVVNHGAVIAAGDDWNDLSMLEEADIKIVMETAPEPLLKRGDIIAPSASKMGIIQGLEEAVKRAR